MGMAYPASLGATKPSLAVRVPLDGPVRVGWGGDKVSSNYHGAYPEQRWAYDLLVEPAFQAAEALEDYGCYGEPVFAPISATVAHDGEPDQVPGSLSVVDGDRVTEGDVIGACGNNGNTSKPHVHIHYAHYLAPVTITPVLGYDLPLYYRDLEGPETPKGGFRVEDGKAVFTGDVIQHTGPTPLTRGPWFTIR